MALTEIPSELSSTPSIVDGGNATAITIDSSENVTFSGTATAASFASVAGGTFTTAAGNDLNIVYPDGRSLFFKEAGTTTLTLDNAQGASFAGAVGIKTAVPDGTLHVHTASAGTVAASSQADDLVVENSAEGGMTIITPNDQSARIRFTSPATNNDVGGAAIFYRQNINKMSIGTEVSGGQLILLSGAGNQTMTLNAAGNAGIGTTNFATTGAKLQVKGTSAAPAISGGNFTGSIFSVEGTSTVNISMGTTGASSYDGWIQAHDAGSGTNYNLLLNPLGGGVGIGTLSPSHVLDVANPTASASTVTASFRAGGDNDNNRSNLFIGQQSNSRGLLLRAGRESGDRAIAQFILNGSGNTIGSNIINFLESYQLAGTAYETTFNQDGENVDFRVESETQSHALFVDASNGLVNINTTDTSVANNTGSARGINLGFGYIEVAAYQNTVLYLNRMNNDGTIVDLRQNGSTEGTISVAGSTVNYNGFAGRHESSGIATSTARGTVVSTIDELDTYPANSNKAGQTRADHAKVKVSDSVGDARVYGVVGDFDENDKLFVVSVGIASVKVTGSCSGGDLLESNGDGTAKVQSDNLIKSSTIGKVTIRNSDTGVKLVSCVLYCG